jgi:hypothetical protein
MLRRAGRFRRHPAEEVPSSGKRHNGIAQLRALITSWSVFVTTELFGQRHLQAHSVGAVICDRHSHDANIWRRATKLR